MIGIGASSALAAGVGLLWWNAAHPSARPSAAQQDSVEARLQRAVAARPDDASARLELGKYYEGQNRPFEAMWEYAEARHLAPAHPELPLRVAAVLRGGHAIDLAIAQLLEGLRARPEDLEVRRGLADLYLATAEPQRARSLMEERRTTAWEDADATLTLGRVRQAAGDDAGAVAAFRRAIALDSSHHRAWYYLGRLYLRLGRSEEARDAFFHAMAAARDRPDYPFYAGMTYLQQNGPGDAQRAVSFFKDALALDSNYAPAHYHVGVALERMGRRRDALTRYSFAVLTDGSYPEPNLTLGRGLTAVGEARQANRFLGRYYDLTDRPAQALQAFQAMAASGEGVVPALLVSQVYIRTQQSEKAARTVEAALKRHPNDVRLLERLAALKIQLGDRPYARRLLHRWLKLQPKASQPYWLLGRCDLGELKYAEGIARLEQAIARDPRNPHALGFLGAALLRLSTPESRERAVDVLRQAVALAPDDAQYRDLYGQALQRVGRHEEARREFLRALDADPARVACYTPVSQLAWRLKRPGPTAFFPSLTRSVQRRVSEENILWPHVWQHPEDDEGRLQLARFFCQYGQLDRARDQLAQILERRPDSMPARQLLERVQRAQEAL